MRNLKFATIGDPASLAAGIETNTFVPGTGFVPAALYSSGPAIPFDRFVVVSADSNSSAKRFVAAVAKD